MADSVLKLEPVSFKWKATGKDDIGFIAQEVEKLLPHIVTTGVDGFKAVDYPRIGVYTVQTVQRVHRELEEKAAELEGKDVELEKKLSDQEQVIEELRNELAVLKDLLHKLSRQ